MKKKYVKLCIKEKCCLIKDVEGGMRKVDAAKKYHIDQSSITYILGKKDKYLNANSKRCLRKKSRLNKGQHSLMEFALVNWIKQKRNQGFTVNGPLIREKASMINEELIRMEKEAYEKKATQKETDSTESGEESNKEKERSFQRNKDKKIFKASDGWLSRFKARHGMREIRLAGEKLSADTESADNAHSEIRQFLVDNGYSLDNVYNADETGLYFKSLPDKTLAFEDEKCASGFKANKKRVTIMNCSNATGSHKIPLLMIGKSAKPRCFHNGKVILPLYYASQKNSWMTGNKFFNIK